MILIHNRTRDRFWLTLEEVEYIMTILSYDISYDTHQLLINSEHLEAEDAHDISEKIDFCLNNLEIYEHLGSDDMVVPIINPSDSALKEQFIINPISDTNKQLMINLSKFLSKKERINIE